MVTSSKESIISKVQELVDLFSKEVMKLDKFSVEIKDNVDIPMGATRTLIEDIRAFNKKHVGDMMVKKELMARYLKILRTLLQVFMIVYQGLFFDHNFDISRTNLIYGFIYRIRF